MKNAGFLRQPRYGGLRCLDATTLKILAMVLMAGDHAYMILPIQSRIPMYLGRLAFPIFAFQIAEGYARTKDFKRYFKRMLLFAVLSEVPFDLMAYGTVFYPFHQNVLWTFCIALLMLRMIDHAYRKEGVVRHAAAWLMFGALGLGLGFVTFVDYYGWGVVTVLLFALCRGRKLGWLGEIAGLFFINERCLGGMQITVLGVQFSLQALALLALIPIWLYNGKQGHGSKAFRTFCYIFYPAHCLIIYLLAVTL